MSVLGLVLVVSHGGWDSWVLKDSALGGVFPQKHSRTKYLFPKRERMSLRWEAQEKKSQQVGMVNSHVQHEETVAQCSKDMIFLCFCGILQKKCI